jgi:hypothetical protein
MSNENSENYPHLLNLELFFCLRPSSSIFGGDLYKICYMDRFQETLDFTIMTGFITDSWTEVVRPTLDFASDLLNVSLEALYCTTYYLLYMDS